MTRYDDKANDYEDIENVSGIRNIRYRKKPYSHRSKASAKSKHKHIYEECLLETSEKEYYRATRCKVCGKIGEVHFFEAERDEKLNAARLIPRSEVKGMYLDLPVYYVDSIWDKFA